MEVPTVLAGLCALLAGGGVEAGEAALRLTPGRLPVVALSLGGQGPFDFLVDTGSATTLVDGALVERLGLRPVDRVEVVGPGGLRVVPRAQLPELTVAGETVPGPRAPFADLASLREADPSLEGILGRDVLGRFDVLIDFAAGRLRLDRGQGRGLPGAARLPLAEDGSAVVAALGRDGGRPLRLLLDSGAASLVLYGAPGPATGVELSPAGAGWRVSGVSGASDAAAVRVRALDIGGHRFAHLEAAVLAGRDPRGYDGLLPAALFGRVFLGYRSGHAAMASGRAPALAPLGGAE